MEKKIETPEILKSPDALVRELKEERKKNNSLVKTLWTTNVLWAILVIFILMLFKCSSDEKDAQNAKLTAQIDSLKNANNLLQKENLDCNSRKPALMIEDINGNKRITSIIVSAGDKRPSSIIIKKHDCPVYVPAICPPVDEIADDVILDTNTGCDALEESIVASLTKQSPDSLEILTQRRAQLKSFLLDSVPAVSYLSEPYYEYKLNPYRAKTMENFWWATGLASAGANLYIISESLGNPKFYDDKDNSKAQNKSNLILGLRVGTGVLAVASLVEFGRTIYFFNKEGKFIVGPNKIGFTVNLDKPVQKIKK